MCDDVPDRTEASESKGVDTVAFEDMLNEAPARKKTIREMIKLYDRSSDETVSKGNALFGVLSLTNEALDSAIQREGSGRTSLRAHCDTSYSSLSDTHKLYQTIP